MGVRLLSRWARGPAFAGIDPVKKPARDPRVAGQALELSERARMSRWARGPAFAGIDPVEKPARDPRGLTPATGSTERAE